MDEQQKEELIRQFREYLETDFAPEPPEHVIDQMTMFGELAGLKNEVRIESRQFKKALDDFREVFSTLDHAHQDMSSMLAYSKEQEEAQGRSLLEPVVYDLIELYDRLEAGMAWTPPQPSLLKRLVGIRQQSRKWMQGYKEGMEMLAERALGVLNRCGVVPVKATGEPFNPRNMNATGFESNSRQPNGMVCREERKGFVMDGRCIRPAEVIVNKREELSK